MHQLLMGPSPPHGPTREKEKGRISLSRICFAIKKVTFIGIVFLSKDFKLTHFLITR